VSVFPNEDVAFSVSFRENFPSHRTICDFRVRHLTELTNLFAELVALASTKVKVNASKRKVMS
jgi:hypothetical protein